MKYFCSFTIRAALKGKNLLPLAGSKFFPLRADPILEAILDIVFKFFFWVCTKIIQFWLLHCILIRSLRDPSIYYTIPNYVNVQRMQSGYKNVDTQADLCRICEKYKYPILLTGQLML